MSKNSTYRNIFIKSLLIFLGVITSLFFAELLLRMFLPPKTSLKFYDNPIFGSAFIPNQKGLFVSETKEYSSEVKVNSQGWPDIGHSFEKPEGVYRILILGDSFVENFQVPFEKRFFRQLQDKLGNKFEIIAIGRGNTGTAQQYLILKEYGLKYKPDLVIQMFLTANDIKNNSPVLQNDPYLPYFSLSQDNNLVLVPQIKRSQRKLATVKEFLKKCRVTELLLSVRQKLRERKDNVKFGGYPLDYHVYDQTYSEEYQKAWDVTYKLISETKKEVEGSKSKYLFIAFPGSEAVEKKKLESLYQTYPEMKAANLDLEKPNKLLSILCQKENIDCLFLQPPEGTYNWLDGHWNQKGIDFTTDFIFDNLKNYLTIK